MAESNKNVRLQGEHHELVEVDDFHSIEEWCLYLMHVRAHKEAASHAKNRDVLDLGCNLGYGSKILAETARSVVGTDVSARAIRFAKERFEDSNLRFEVAGEGRISLRDSSVDLVTCFQVIEHVEDVPTFMAEIQRVLKPNGKVILTTPNASIRLDPSMKPWNPYHVREYTHVQLADEVARYFGSVEIHGLTAADSAYEIEYNRCQRAKAQARNRIRRSAVAAVKTLLPSTMLENIRSARRGPPLTTVELNELAVDDFWYEHRNLDSALDLMAICSQPERV